MKNNTACFSKACFEAALCLVILLSLSSANLFAQGTWSASPALPAIGRQLAISFAVNGKVYAGTGWNSGYRNDLFVFDPATNIWTTLSNTPFLARQGAVAFTDGTKAFVFSGSSSNNKRTDLWEYFSATDTWVQRTSCPKGFFGASSFVLGDKAYVIGGGFYPQSPETLCWRYDMANDTWLQMNDFSGPGRYFANTFVLNGEAYYGLGTSSSSHSSVYKDFWKYNEAADTWSPISDIPGAARQGAFSFAMCNKAFVGNGASLYGGPTNYNDMYSYDAPTDTWTAETGFPSVGMAYSQAVVVGDDAYVGTGRLPGNSFLKNFWKFTCNSSPLPIELIHFDLVDDGEDVKTYWSTATETNNDYFTILRSKDGVIFQQIGMVPGGGNSNSQINYEFYDNAPYSGISYYQLKQTDFDGTSFLSNIVPIYRKPSSIINIYPNPAENELQVYIGSAINSSTTVEVINNIGQKVINNNYNIEMGNTTLIINVSSLTTGIYNIRAISSTGEYFHQEFVKR